MPRQPFHTPGAGGEQRLTAGVALALMALGAVLLLRLLLPWLVVGGLGLAGVWLWRRQRARNHALHQIFYAELTAQGGRISVLDFAMAAQITGSEARQFLDQRAQEFWGDFEATATGDVVYVFAAQRPRPQPADFATGLYSGSNLCLDGAALAQRLGCAETDLAQHRTSPTFSAWSRQRDPDGCGWRYDAGGDRYRPVPDLD